MKISKEYNAAVKDVSKQLESIVSNCPRCLFDSTIAEIGEHQCEYCDIHDALEKQSNPQDLDKELDKIRKQKGKYNCIVGISGGLDSSAMLYAAVKWWGLRPLVIHFDNNWNSEIAKSNMRNLVEHLNVDLITYNVNKEEYDTLNDAFLVAGVPDADIPNDIAMTKLMYETAHKYGIKYILNGHDFRQEGSTPRAWTYMDAEYIRSIYEWHTHLKLVNYPLFTFKDQLFYTLKGIKQVRPFHFITDRTGLEREMIGATSWKSYGAKHGENIYTAFVGAWLLPNKFSIDKRRVYLSAQIRSGAITKEDALEKLKESPEFDRSQIPAHKFNLVWGPCRSRKEFKSYDFQKYRVLIWILYRLKVVPYTFYKKYCFQQAR